jgi:hypothetical protein
MRFLAEAFQLQRPGMYEPLDRYWHMHLPNALVQLQAQYNHCGEAASKECLSAPTFVRWRAIGRCAYGSQMPGSPYTSGELLATRCQM